MIDVLDRLGRSVPARANPHGMAARSRTTRLCVESLEVRVPISSSILGLVGASLLGDLVESGSLGGEAAWVEGLPDREIASLGEPREIDLDVWEVRSLREVLPPALSTETDDDALAEWDDEDLFDSPLIDSLAAWPAEALIEAAMLAGLSGEHFAGDAALAAGTEPLEGAFQVDAAVAADVLAAKGGAGGIVAVEAASAGAVAAESTGTEVHSASGFSVTLADEVPEPEAALTDTEEAELAAPLPEATGDETLDEGLLLGGIITMCGCGCGCGGGCGCGCGGGGGYAPMPELHPGHGDPDKPTEIFLDAAGDSYSIVLTDFFIPGCACTPIIFSLNKEHSVYTADLVKARPEDLLPTVLVLNATGQVGSSILIVEAKHSTNPPDADPTEWTMTIYACGVQGFVVQERGWGEDFYSAPEDQGSDWRLLWTADAHRWTPVPNCEAAGNVIEHHWAFRSPDGQHSYGSAGATWCHAMPYSEWDEWAYGSPSGLTWPGPSFTGGPFTATPTVTFGSVVETYYTRPATATMAPTPPSPQQPALSLHMVDKVEWEEVAYSRTEWEPARGRYFDFCKLQNDGGLWKAYPSYGPPTDLTTVRAKVTVVPAIPEPMVGTIHVAWYDPINVLANLPSGSLPSHDTANQVRDNDEQVTLSMIVDNPLEYTPGKTVMKAYYEIDHARLGDNFQVAVHPRLGRETSYHFGTGCEGEVLKYRDYPTGCNWTNPGKPDFSAPLVEHVLPASLDSRYPGYRTPVLHVIPSLLLVDSNNDLVINAADEHIKNHPQHPGKFILVNNNDDNDNGVPDWQDFENEDANFAEAKVFLPEGVDPNIARWKFEFDPTRIRLWTQNGARLDAPINAPNDPGHVIPADEAFDASLLTYENGTATLFIEGLSPSAGLGTDTITLWLEPDVSNSLGFVADDVVRLTVFSVEIAMAFNHVPGDNSDAAMNLRQSASANTEIIAPEWHSAGAGVALPDPAPNDGNINQRAVLYEAWHSVDVFARFEVQPTGIESITVSAEGLRKKFSGEDGYEALSIGDLAGVTVTFDTATGISNGATGGAAVKGINGIDGFVGFAAGDTAGSVLREEATFRWQISGVSAGPIADGQMSLQEVFKAEDIMIYTILAEPGALWDVTNTPQDDIQMPWATVLDLVTRETYPTTGDVPWAGGATTVEEAAERITTVLNEGGRFRYEEHFAGPRYIEAYPWPLGSDNPTAIHNYFDLTAYHNQITGAGGAAFANCLDMGWGVVILSNLLGDALEVARLRNPAGFTTYPVCPVGSVPSEHSSWIAMDWNFHSVAFRPTSSTVYDACLRFDANPDPATIDDILPVNMPETEYATRLTNATLDINVDPLIVDLLQ